MNVLITGHSGFIGRSVADCFVKRGHVVYGVSRSLRPDCDYRQYNVDIADSSLLAQLAGENCIDVVVHLAGKPLVIDCDKDPFNAYKTNGLGAAAILEAARSVNAKAIMVETDKVYGRQAVLPTSETASLNPSNAYEMSKILASMLSDFYRKHYAMNVISVRPCNVFGGSDTATTRIMPAALHCILQGKGIPVHEHALQMYRDFIYVKDVAEMLYILATKPTQHSVYNLSTYEAMSIFDFAQRVTEILEHDVAPIIVPSPGDYEETEHQSIDGSRFNDEFAFVCTPFETATLESYQSYCDQFNLPILGR